MDYGRYLTFQRKLTGFGAAISQASSSNLLAKVVVPFVRTPINLLKFATERSPAAPMLSEWRADFRAGGERRAVHRRGLAAHRRGRLRSRARSCNVREAISLDHVVCAAADIRCIPHQ